jgi:hypothetical protein
VVLANLQQQQKHQQQLVVVVVMQQLHSYHLMSQS